MKSLTCKSFAHSACHKPCHLNEGAACWTLLTIWFNTLHHDSLCSVSVLWGSFCHVLKLLCLRIWWKTCVCIGTKCGCKTWWSHCCCMELGTFANSNFQRLEFPFQLWLNNVWKAMWYGLKSSCRSLERMSSTKKEIGGLVSKLRLLTLKKIRFRLLKELMLSMVIGDWVNSSEQKYCSVLMLSDTTLICIMTVVRLNLSFPLEGEILKTNAGNNNANLLFSEVPKRAFTKSRD